ncbi:DUF2605 domain-containing protein [Leptothermofonsia sichuanensis E412]|uniref:DUF2605 domain-containing protein n=1 Tax=Leptothermofonsia sichuanensis TaxID=2917832 RepID=UPI001CA788A0|nr:DUF2605 domain-containing protein [Leptothermofonsia sichuanensis]QZZ22491.1 DUF2605 domain-containing protein [Leptothermofonsia sichuanensis E412]
MSGSDSPNTNLLQSLLEPLLDDFQYWFERARLLLETENITFLSEEQQTDLLARVISAQQEVNTARILLKETNGQVGIEPSILAPWHQLVMECWQTGRRFRLEQSA